MNPKQHVVIAYWYQLCRRPHLDWPFSASFMVSRGKQALFQITFPKVAIQNRLYGLLPTQWGKPGITT